MLAIKPKREAGILPTGRDDRKTHGLLCQLDYLNMNEPTGENEQNEETIDPSLPYRLEIIKLFDEAAHSQATELLSHLRFWSFKTIVEWHLFCTQIKKGELTRN